jgi:cysteinyl-tRNA synthetase
MSDTPLTLTNTASRSKESLPPPAEAGEIKLYTCGPTVYNRVHLGNLRAFLSYDLLRRGLEWLGYSVRHVMNITDVDDKTIRDSRKAGVSLQEFTERYTQVFLEDLAALNVRLPHVMPRATEAIEPMVEMVEKLLAQGSAYRGEDGSVYFKIDAFPDYGKLSHLDKRTLKTGAGGRVAADEYDKENAQDFALWKAWTEADGDVFWETSLGKGRPGWHLECSALAMEHLGPSIDIHAGGVDLVFPHHENEIAQSEAATGLPFSRYWVHNEHLLVSNQKMSKSLNNFYTFQDLQTIAGATPREVRYALLSVHYRSQLNFMVEYEGQGADRKAVRFESIEAARGALKRVDEFRRSLGARDGGPASEAQRARLEQARAAFRAAVADDLNVPRALAALFELIGDLNRDKLRAFDPAFGREVEALLDDADEVLGVLQPETVGLDPDEQGLFDGWAAAREAKDWPQADALRDRLTALGIQVQARKGENTWVRL